jgi:hypothetical protein
MITASRRVHVREGVDGALIDGLALLGRQGVVELVFSGDEGVQGVGGEGHGVAAARLLAGLQGRHELIGQDRERGVHRLHRGVDGLKLGLARVRALHQGLPGLGAAQLQGRARGLEALGVLGHLLRRRAHLGAGLLAHGVLFSDGLGDLGVLGGDLRGITVLERRVLGGRWAAVGPGGEELGQLAAQAGPAVVVLQLLNLLTELGDLGARA